MAAIERVQRYTEGLDLASFLGDEKTVDAVCFCYGVIGEAARHIPDVVVGAYPDLPWADLRSKAALPLPPDLSGAGDSPVGDIDA